MENDDKGRAPIGLMTDRELLEELVTTVRQLGDALESLGKNPALRMMIPGGLGIGK